MKIKTVDLEKLEDILFKVEKPARYTGGEINVRKSFNKDDLSFVFAFPDVYEVGMSHLGMHILYKLINNTDGLSCERVFSPWPDMEKEMRQAGIPLYTLETKTPLNEVDILGFTLQYELSYTNILNMLNMSGIPLRSSERIQGDYPLIIAGGPCAYNPEPLYDVVDLFILGEGEEVNVELFNLYKGFLQREDSPGKTEFLKEACKIEGIYVPSLYDVKYGEDGRIEMFKPNCDEAPARVKKRIARNLNETFYPEKMLVPNVAAVHDRAMIEVFRGCTKGCRFCQAGMIYRPVRERKLENVVEIANELMKNTGYEEMSLTSLSTLDHSQIKDIIMTLIDKNKDKMIGVSLPSLRLDSFSIDILNEIQKVRKTGLTFAPEAGTQRLRDVINKGVTEEDLRVTMEQVFANGWNKVKLYFMMGLPTETHEDLTGIAELGNLVTYTHKITPRELRRDGLTVTISVSCFVPKPFTPFQFIAQPEVEEFQERQKFLRKEITNKKVKFNYHDATTSFVEGVFARGDRRICNSLIRAYELGCIFDGWNDYFDYEKWLQAFEDTAVDPKFYANRERDFDEINPWDFIDIGVTKDYLIKEYNKALNADTTQDCRLGCTGCGVNTNLLGGACFDT